MAAPRPVLVALALALTACHKAAPGAPVVSEVRARVVALEPADLPRPDEAELAAQAGRAAANGGLPVALGRGDGPRLRVQLEVELGWRPAGVLRAVLRARVEPIGAAAGAVRVVRDAAIDKEGLVAAPTAAEVGAHLKRAIDLVVGGAARAEQLWLGPAGQARIPIAGEDADLREEAIRIAAERHDHEAVPALLPLLKAEDPELRDRAIGALAEIGDPRAARPLADLAKLGDLAELPKILDAISRAGGTEAEQYLEFVADGHSSAEIRELAQRALEHLRARKR